MRPSLGKMRPIWAICTKSGKGALEFGGGESWAQPSQPVSQQSLEPLQHVDQLVDETRCMRFFNKMDFAMAY